MSYTYLVIEDDELAKINIEMLLRGSGKIIFTSTEEEALSIINNKKIDIAFIDLDLDENLLAGINLISPCIDRKIYPVVLSGREEDEVIEKAYERGCQDFLSKPFSRDGFNLILKKFELVKSSHYIEMFFKEQFITGDQDLINQLNILKEVLVNDRPIYLRGATGTGKTYIARLIHQLIFSSPAHFVHLNCSEIPENLLESELFGHEKGAFTGAISRKVGKLALADGGTLFLDEVATMPKNIQKKLLRVIEEKSFTPLGGQEVIYSNFRLISATCDDLEQMVRDGEFREDLFFRLEGYNIQLKELRKRKKDIPILIRYFMSKRSRRVVITPQVMDILKCYSWPGNVRELEKLVDILVAKERGIITIDELPDKFRTRPQNSIRVINEDVLTFVEEYGMKAYIEQIEEELVAMFLNKFDGRVRDAFNALKISSSSFYRIRERNNDKDKR